MVVDRDISCGGSTIAVADCVLNVSLGANGSDSATCMSPFDRILSVAPAPAATDEMNRLFPLFTVSLASKSDGWMPERDLLQVALFQFLFQCTDGVTTALPVSLRGGCREMT